MANIIFTNTGLMEYKTLIQTKKNGFSDEFFRFRIKTKWGSTDGSNRFIKDISDSHLENIIIWVVKRPMAYDEKTLRMLRTEKVYRQVKNIKVPEYNK